MVFWNHETLAWHTDHRAGRAHGGRLLPCPRGPPATITLLNVSYDPTREFYREFNEAFAAHWKQQTGKTLTVDMSHGGSGKQARAVIDGLQADVVTLALAYDIDAIAPMRSCCPADWQTAPAAQQRALHLDHRVPGAQGQPQGHPRLGRSDQAGRRGDHAQPEDVRRRALELPGRLGLGAQARTGRSGEAARPRAGRRPWPPRRTRRAPSSASCSSACPVLDSGARGSTNTFVQRGIGDVLLAWENEAFLAVNELGPDKVDIVVPSLSILAEPPVTLVDANVDTPRHAQGRRGLPAVAVLARRDSAWRRSTTTGRSCPSLADPGRCSPDFRRSSW